MVGLTPEESDRPPERPSRLTRAAVRPAGRPTRREWSDWRWQWAHRLTRRQQIENVLGLHPEEREAFHDGRRAIPFAVTPYYLSLIDPYAASDPIRSCMIPTSRERVRGIGEADDPLGEERHSPFPGLVHRYPDRVLLLATDRCAAYCRYCTRSRLVGRTSHRHDRRHLTRSIEYIRSNPSIRDVLVSGGDPLVLEDDAIAWLLREIRAIRHVEIVRIGTKVPAVLPQRVTPELVRMLRRFHPLWISVHFTHPAELTPEAARACGRLADAGIPLGSQTVLLRGVNDDPSTMRDLCLGLLRNRVRPYYLYQCDPIPGSSHFRTSVAAGVEIVRSLRGFVTGYAVPTFVVDAPGGGGKIPVMPDYARGHEGTDLKLLNYAGEMYRYPDPGCWDEQPGASGSWLPSREEVGA